MDKKRFSQGYVGLIFFVMFIYGISNQAIGTLITRIITHYGIKMAEAGLLSSFANAGNFAAIFIVTFFTGRINKIILMGASLFFYSASLYLISTAPLFGILLGSFALIGLFGATTDTLTNSLVADLLPNNISRSMSFLHGIFGLGGLCGPILIERFAGNRPSFGGESWAQVYFIISVAFFMYLLIYAVFVKWQWSILAVRLSHDKQAGFGFSDIVQFFGQKQCVLLWAAMFFYGGNQSTLSVWIKRYVETHLDAPAWGAYALSAMWLGIAISRLIVSPVIKASSPKKICFGNFISAVALAAGLFSNSAPGITAASLLVGLSSGLSIPLIIAMGCEWHREKTAFGALMPFTACFIAYVVFPPLSGLVSDSLGIPWGVALGAASAFLTAVFSGVLDMNLRIPGALKQ